MTLFEAILLFGVAALASAINSVAGGGSFLSFPSLLFLGIPPINANATNTLGIWPGQLASAAAYRGELRAQRRLVILLGISSAAGGILGAAVLLRTPPATFVRAIPWLLLAATMLLIFNGPISEWVRRQVSRGTNSSHGSSRNVLLLGVLLQVVISIYIGYFGAGAGILMLASLALIGQRNIHSMNAVKIVCAMIANGVAVITFIGARAIVWPQALIMMIGATLGGYGGAWYAQKIDPRYVRWFAIAVGAAMTVYFFVRYY